MYNNGEEELVNRVKKLRRFFNQKVRPMPRQSLLAMKVAFGIRAQYATIALVATFMITQLVGVLIFSGSARAIGTIYYGASINTRASSSTGSVAKNSSGDLYLADHGNHVISRYSSDGTPSGDWGSLGSGDGQFGDTGPTRVSVGADDKVYVLDNGNSRVQVFDVNGGFIGKFGSAGSGDGQFNFGICVGGVAADSAGNIYVGDPGNHRIQKFDSAYNYVAQWGVSGSGAGDFGCIRNVAISAGDVMYVSEGNSAPRRVQMFSLSGITPGNFIDEINDPAFVSPSGVSFDEEGYVYVADEGQDRFWKFDPTGGSPMQSWVNTSTGAPTNFVIPVSGGEFYTSDEEGGSGSPARFIKKIDGSGATLFTFANSTRSMLNKPGGVAVGPDDSLYVLSTSSGRIMHYDYAGNYINQFGTAGSSNGKLNYARGIVTDRNGNVYVADTYNNRIQKFDANGTYITKWGSSGSDDGQFQAPRAVAVDIDGNVYVTDDVQNRVQKFSSSGTFLTSWGSTGSGNGQFLSAYGVAVDAGGNVYVADAGNNRIQKFDTNGTYLAKWGSTGSGNGQFNFPNGVAVDAAGRVYVSDATQRRVQKFAADGTFITKFGSSGSGDGQFNFYNSDTSFYTASIASFNSGNGTGIYVADPGNNRVQVLYDQSLDLRITTLPATNITQTSATLNLQTNYMATAGDIQYSFDNDGPSNSFNSGSLDGMSTVEYARFGVTGTGAADGQVADAEGVARDNQGNLYVLDAGNCRVQKFTSAGTFVSKFGSCGSGTGQFSSPVGITVDYRNVVYVSESNAGNQRVQSFDSDGTYLDTLATNVGQGCELQDPRGMAVGPDNVLYVSDLGTDHAEKFNQDGSCAGAVNLGTISGNGRIAVDSKSNLYVAEYDNGVVSWYYPSGSYAGAISSPGTGSGHLQSPYQIHIDQNDILYVADTIGNTRIQMFKSGSYLSSVSVVTDGSVSSIIAGITTQLDGTVDAVLTNANNNGVRPGIMFKRVGTYTHQGLTSLTCGTNYTFRAKAIYYGGDSPETLYGSQVNFTTLACATPMTITTTSLPDGTAGTAYSEPVEVANPSGSVTYSISSGSLPAGLTIDSNTGVISGTPSQPSSGTLTFTVTAQDDTTTVAKELSIYIAVYDPIGINTCDSIFTIGTTVNAAISTHDGVGFPVIEVISGSLPTGLTLDGAGNLTGTPTTSGVYQPTVEATDLTGTAQRACNMIVYDPSVSHANTPLVTITSPSTDTTLEHDDVVVTGTGPASSTVAVYVDNYQVATTNIDGLGNWTYHVQNIFPGTHQFDAKWLPVGNLTALSVGATLDSPSQSIINLVDTGTNKVVKRYYANAQALVFNTKISKAHNKAYMVTSVDGVGADIAELDLATGVTSTIVSGIDITVTSPALLALSADEDVLYAVTATQLVKYTISQQSLEINNLPSGTFNDEVLYPAGALTADDSKLYIAYASYPGGQFTRSIMSIDIATRAVNNYDLGPANPFSLINYAYMVGDTFYGVYSDGVIVAFNTTNDQISKSIDMQLADNTNVDVNDYEQVFGISLDRQNMMLYASVTNNGALYTDMRSVNLQTDQVSQLAHLGESHFQLLAYDTHSQDLYVHSITPVANTYRGQLDVFDLATNDYVVGSGYPIVDELPSFSGYGYGDNSTYSPNHPFVASISFKVPDPVIVVDPCVDTPSKPCIDQPEDPQPPDPPTVTDVTPPARPAATSAVKKSPTVVAVQNNLFAFAKRIPEPLAIGFPWLLLLLALILVAIQYYQVHSESLTTAHIKAAVDNQKRLVEEQNNFVALSTHYLHTPLTVIEGEITLMVKAGTLTEAQATRLKATLSSLNNEAEAVLAQEEQYEPGN